MKRIVLVEDDEPIRDIFRIVFGKSDYDFIYLESGEEIINSEIGTPDLFILDKQISGTNGLNVCRFIKNNRKFRNVPVIMISANPDIRTLARDAGADDAISKPFSLEELRKTVTKYAGHGL